MAARTRLRGPLDSPNPESRVANPERYGVCHTRTQSTCIRVVLDATLP